ncbi:hypothetical protein BDV29DRAFT_190981 [Aspergillus leporis]|uniref:FAD/NAD(P)-binding domain-containing protein n=1 Tax=Aspergillus leporis TaxID=41062 RepID=A0A5N5X4Z6_9EURO|nr:hypothetical protein BDV29DRAFT_190981 [Aspergillus leporis]
MSHVVIIGASFAGIPNVHSLLKDIPSCKITLINPSPTFYFTIAAPRILAKRDAFKSEQYLLPIEKVFRVYPKNSFKFIQGHASAIDVSAKTKNATPIPFKQSNFDNVKALIHNAQDRINTAQNIIIGGAGPIGTGQTKIRRHPVSASDRILPMLKPAGSAAAEKLLVTQGVISPDPGKWTVTLDNEGSQLDADLYISTTGVLPNNDFIPAEVLID